MKICYLQTKNPSVHEKAYYQINQGMSFLTLYYVFNLTVFESR